jgi:hypothetical protein
MPLISKQYVLASSPVMHPLAGTELVPPAPVGIHVTYVEYKRIPGPPGHAEPDFIPEPTLTYQDGSQSQRLTVVESDLPEGLGRCVTAKLETLEGLGEVFFTLLLPEVKPRAGTVEAITSVGITSRRTAPGKPIDPPQEPVYSAAALYGTFSETGAPLPDVAQAAQT